MDVIFKKPPKPKPGEKQPEPVPEPEVEVSDDDDDESDSDDEDASTQMDCISGEDCIDDETILITRQVAENCKASIIKMRKIVLMFKASPAAQIGSAHQMEQSCA